MYRFEEKQLSFTDFNQPQGLQMNPENRWIRKAEMIPWDTIEKEYAKLFPSRTGMPAKPLRMALGSLLIQKQVDGLLDDLVAKSNWERYFSDKIQVENLSSKWEKLYGYRNQVAHAKRMKKDEFEDATSIITELKPAFESCLDHIDEVTIQSSSSFKIPAGMSKALQLMAGAITSSVDRDKIESNLLSVGPVFSSALNAVAKEFVILSSGVEAIQQYRDNVHDIMKEIGAIAHCDAHDDYWYNTGKFSDDEILDEV